MTSLPKASSRLAALWPVEAEKIASMPKQGLCKSSIRSCYIDPSSKGGLAIALFHRYSKHKVVPPAATRERLLEAIWSETSVSLESASLYDLDQSSAWLTKHVLTYVPPAKSNAHLMQDMFYPHLNRAAAAGDLDRFAALSKLQDKVSKKVA